MNVHQPQIYSSPSQTFTYEYTEAISQMLTALSVLGRCCKLKHLQAPSKEWKWGKWAEWGAWQTEEHTLCLRGASIVQLKLVTDLQKCRSSVIRLSNFLEARNQYF